MISRIGWPVALTLVAGVLLATTSVLGIREIRPTQASAGATLTVNTTADNSLVDNFLTLREAINLTTGVNDLLSYTAGECAQISNSSYAGTCTTTDDLGTGSNETIVFAPGVFPPGAPATISLGSALPVNTDPVGITIDGSGAGVIIDGGGLVGSEDGLVAASGAGNDLQDVTLRSLTIQNFPGTGVRICGGDAVNCADGLSDTRIDDVTSGGNGGLGIFITGESNDSAHVVDSVAEDNGGDGVRVNAKSDNSNATITGTEAHDNGFDGLEVNAGDNTTGATVTGNMATGNAFRGLQINAGDATIDPIVTGNTFTGNDSDGAKINAGTDHMVSGAMVTGNTLSNNGRHGLQISSGALASPANLIADNEAIENVEDGFNVGRGSGHTVSRNMTTDNGQLGIDLFTDADVPPGVTLNDAGDADEGTNDLLNYPEVDTVGGQAIAGSACDGCTIELFRSDGDPSGLGEGETFLTDAPANAGGVFSLAICDFALEAGDSLTMTATSPSGSTSEFSPNFTLGVSAESCPTPSPTQSPTPTAEPETLIWGDNNCSGSVNPVDSLLTLRFDAGLSTNTGDCPDFDQVVDVADASPHAWGDIDCSGEVTPVDSLKVLRFDAGLGVSQEADCPPMGSEVEVLE